MIPCARTYTPIFLHLINVNQTHSTPLPLHLKSTSLHLASTSLLLHPCFTPSCSTLTPPLLRSFLLHPCSILAPTPPLPQRVKTSYYTTFMFSKNTIYHANIQNIFEIRIRHISGCFSTLYQGRLDTLIPQDVSIKHFMLLSITIDQ